MEISSNFCAKTHRRSGKVGKLESWKGKAHETAWLSNFPTLQLFNCSAGSASDKMPVERHHVVDIPLGFPKRRDSIVTGDGVVTGVVRRQRQLEVAAIPIQVATQDAYGRVNIPNGVGRVDAHGAPRFRHQLSQTRGTSHRLYADMESGFHGDQGHDQPGIDA